MKSALRQVEKSKGEMRCMKAKLLFVAVSLAVVLTSSSFLADAGKAPSLYAERIDALFSQSGHKQNRRVVQKLKVVSNLLLGFNNHHYTVRSQRFNNAVGNC